MSGLKVSIEPKDRKEKAIREERDRQAGIVREREWAAFAEKWVAARREEHRVAEEAKKKSLEWFVEEEKVEEVKDF